MAGLRGIRAVFATAVLASCAGSPEAASDNAKWFGIYVDGGARIGASSSTVTPWQGGERIVETFEMLVREADNRGANILDRITRFTDAQGRTTHIERVSGNGRDMVSLAIDIRDGAAFAVRKTAYDQNTMKVDLPASVRFDNGDDLLPAWDFSAKGDLSFENFNTSALTVERVVMRLLSSDAATGERRLERSAYRDGALRSISEFTINVRGEVVETAMDMFGARMVMRPITEAEAATPATSASFVASVMVKSPHRISSHAAQGHIRYVFGFTEGRAFDLPQTHEQKVMRDGEKVIVDICGDCGPGLSTDLQFLGAGLKPTMWLQSGSDRLREIAVFALEEVLSDRKKMEILSARARRIMVTRDFTGHYSALEAAERGAGDCTEDAVLLAALARAAGIPAYVATGLVYSRERYHGVSNAFMPHNWTLAYVDGEWASFDISLEEFDATHIALSVNEGEASSLASAQQLASHLEWRQMMEVRSDSPSEQPDAKR